MLEIDIREIVDEKVWQTFLKKSDFDYFLQTWTWGEFQSKALGKRIWRLGFYNKSELLGICLCVKELSRYGDFVYCPRGPIIDWDQSENRCSVIPKLIEYFESENLAFLRIDPAIIGNDNPVSNELRRLGFQDASTFVQVERAWMLDIENKKEEELMSGMRKKARYYLRQSMKKNINVRFSTNTEDLNIFTDMIRDMSERKKFPVMPKEYYQKEFEYLAKEGIMKLVIAEYKGDPVATALITFYGNEASYLHAASTQSNDGLKLQAPYLLQWKAIEHAKKLGLKRYNFWGIVEDKNYHPGYPGFGYSNFKKGFGGYLEQYMRTKDYPFSFAKYKLNRVVEKLRRSIYKGN